MEETTTDAATQDTQALDAQPVEQPAEAVQTADSEPTTQTTEPEPSADEPVTTDNSDEQAVTEEWLKSKGLDPNDPKAFEKAANMAFNSEKKMSQTIQKASELRKAVETSPAQNDDERVQRLETLYSVNQWKADNKVTPEQDAKMGEYLSSDPMKIRMVTAGLLSLDDVFQLSGASKVDPTAIKKQGGQEALERLANKQRATAPKGSATTNETPKEDPIAAALAD